MKFIKDKIAKSNDIQKITYSQMINTVGSCMTLTGLPVLIAEKTGRAEDSLLLFFFETLASIIFTLFLGSKIDELSKKKISFFGNMMSAILFTMLFFLLKTDSSLPFYAVGFFTSLSNSAALLAESSWFRFLVKSENVSKAIAQRNSQLLVGKIFGMSMGPLLFSTFGSVILLLDVSSYVAAALFIASASEVVVPMVDKQKSKAVHLFNKFTQHARQKYYFKMLVFNFLTGMLCVPMINYCVVNLQKNLHAEAYYLSAFWFIGAFGSFISNQMLAKGVFDGLKRKNIFLISGATLSIAVLSLGLIKWPMLFVLIFVLFTLANPVVNNIFTTFIVERTDRSSLGRITSYEFTLIDLGALVGAVLSMGLVSGPPIVLFSIFCLVSIIRVWIASDVVAVEVA